MAIKFSNILVFIGAFCLFMIILIGCTPPKCLPCNCLECKVCQICPICEVCLNLDNPTNEQYYKIGCIPINEVNEVINVTNQLVVLVNDDIEDNENKLILLPYYIKEEVVD